MRIHDLARTQAIRWTLVLAPLVGMHFSMFEMPLRAGDSEPQTLKIGLSSTLVRHLHKPVLEAGLPPLRHLMKEASGHPCTILPSISAEEAAKQLEKGELQFAVLQGVEFAWCQKKHPQLRPLAIVVYQTREPKAKTVVRQDNRAARWADLKGKSLALPKQSREHCHLFTQRQCRGEGCAAEEFFSRILAPESVEEAIDDIADGLIEAAVVDSGGLTAFARRKPGRFEKLKVICESEPFPDAVVAYYDGIFLAPTLEHFRSELFKAEKKPIGKHIMTLWTITSFEPVPDDFGEHVRKIRLNYPSSLPAVQATALRSTRLQQEKER